MSQDGQNGEKVEFSALPNDIIQIIADFLPNQDIKRVRLVNKRWKANSVLRFPRVFISPNHKNIEVLRSIATQDEFRRQVKELVWDDALLSNWDLSVDRDEDDELGMRDWEYACDASFDNRHSNAVVDPSYQTYRQLYEEQQAIIAAGTDAEALRHALPLFDALERVTVTPTAHLPNLSCPRYETPMFRAFPPEFRCPTPVGWTRSDDDVERHFEQDPSWEEINGPWHGFRVVLKELASCERAVPELVCEVKGESTGIAWKLFDSPGNCEDFRNLETICGRGLRRLDLAVHVAWAQYMPGLAALSRGRLRSVLEKATKMERFSLSTNADESLESESLEDFDLEFRAIEAIPVTKWSNLRHLKLSHLYVVPEDFISFLKRLPTTVESIDLTGMVAYPDPSWAKIFQNIKDELGWTGSKPVVTFMVEKPGSRSMKHWMEHSISKFLKSEGPNPFNDLGGFVKGTATKRFEITPEYMLPGAEGV